MSLTGIGQEMSMSREEGPELGHTLSVLWKTESGLHWAGLVNFKN